MPKAKKKKWYASSQKATAAKEVKTVICHELVSINADDDHYIRSICSMLNIHLHDINRYDFHEDFMPEGAKYCRMCQKKHGRNRNFIPMQRSKTYAACVSNDS